MKLIELFDNLRTMGLKKPNKADIEIYCEGVTGNKIPVLEMHLTNKNELILVFKEKKTRAISVKKVSPSSEKGES